MKRIALALGTVGLVTLGVVGALNEKALRVGNFRIAIADRPCPVEGQGGYNYLISVCNKHKTIGQYCACATKEEDQLNGEMDPVDIPDAAFRRVGVCEWENDEGQTVSGLKWLPVGQTPDPSWDCKLIANRILNWRISHRATKTQLFRALEKKCCAGCLDDCWISPGSWKKCPRCLLDSTPDCSTYCPTPEAP